VRAGGDIEVRLEKTFTLFSLREFFNNFLLRFSATLSCLAQDEKMKKFCCWKLSRRRAKFRVSFRPILITLTAHRNVTFCRDFFGLIHPI
jgi:hypothetical protein